MLPEHLASLPADLVRGTPTVAYPIAGRNRDVIAAHREMHA